MSIISPKLKPSLTPLEAGNLQRHFVDVLIAQLVQPQELASCTRKKVDIKSLIVKDNLEKMADSSDGRAGDWRPKGLHFKPRYGPSLGIENSTTLWSM